MPETTVHMPPAGAHAENGNIPPQKTRIDYTKVAPEALRAQLGLEAYVRGSGLEHPLLELIKLRASMINGCAYCVDMHTKDARYAGETEQRLYAVSVWHETPFFTPRERAALRWTDALTDMAHREISDELYREVSAHFSEKEMVDLTMAIVVINGWNRLAVGFRAPVGDYDPAARAKAGAGTGARTTSA